MKNLHNKNTTKDLTPKILKPKTSYAIVGEDNPLTYLVFRYIIKLNTNQGYHIGKSLFNNYFYLDDKLDPTKDYFVISRVRRNPKIFQNLDIEKEGVNIILGILNIEDQGIITYTLRYMDRKDPLTIYQYLLNQKANNLTLDEYKALVKTRCYESQYYYKDKILIILQALATNKPEKIITLKKFVEKEDMNLEDLINFLTYVANNNLPEYLQEGTKNYYTKKFHQRVDKLMLKLISVETLEEIYLHLLN